MSQHAITLQPVQFHLRPQANCLCSEPDASPTITWLHLRFYIVTAFIGRHQLTPRRGVFLRMSFPINYSAVVHPRCLYVTSLQQLQQCWATMMTMTLMMAVIEVDETLRTSEIASPASMHSDARTLLTSRCRWYWSTCARRGDAIVSKLFLVRDKISNELHTTSVLQARHGDSITIRRRNIWHFRSFPFQPHETKTGNIKSSKQ